MFRSILLGAVALCASTIYAQAALRAAPFTLPALPYAAGSLEPAIDAQTMTIHHDKQRQAYVDAFNKAVVADPGDQ